MGQVYCVVVSEREENKLEEKKGNKLNLSLERCQNGLPLDKVLGRHNKKKDGLSSDYLLHNS